MIDLDKYYEGKITKVSVFKLPENSFTLYGAWIHCKLLINGTYHDLVKLIPCAQCGSMKVLHLRITKMGFKISNNRKSLTTNLTGTPVLATLHKSNSGFIDDIDELIPINGCSQIDKIQVRNSKRRT